MPTHNYVPAIITEIVLFFVSGAVAFMQSLDHMVKADSLDCPIIDGSLKSIVVLVVPCVSNWKHSFKYYIQFSKWTFQVTMEVITIILILKILIDNKSFNKQFDLAGSKQTLPMRTSLKRNIISAKALLPSLILHSFIYSVIYIDFIIPSLIYKGNVPSQIQVIDD